MAERDDQIHEATQQKLEKARKRGDIVHSPEVGAALSLLRARAIENGCFVFAAAQAGMHENKRETYGHSLIIAPWGEILAEGGVEPGVFLAEIDTTKVEAARKTVPSLQHGRRFGIADPKAGPEHLHLVRGSA